MDRAILHIDMNNFYASVECLLNPSLKSYAIAVAGDPNKRTGIILAKNYLAKAYGVKTGEAIWEAKQKCPTLITVSPNFEKYQEYSEKAHQIYYQYTDKIEPFGIDECWLDVTDSLTYFNMSSVELAKKIQKQVRDELGLSVSVGVSWGKTLAKLASDMKKPMGLTIIDRSNHLEILKKTSIDDMIMIGKHTSQKLKKININTLYDLSCLSPDFLEKLLGVVGRYLHNAVCGIDDDTLITPKDEDTKSVGNGATAVHDLTTPQEVKDFLHDLSSKVSARLRKHNFCAKTVHLGIKFADFSYLSAQQTSLAEFNGEQEIFRLSYEIFKYLTGEKFPPIRALRISTTNLSLSNQEKQLNLLSNTKNENLCSTIDTIKEKFGDSIVVLAKDIDSIT